MQVIVVPRRLCRCVYPRGSRTVRAIFFLHRASIGVLNRLIHHASHAHSTCIHVLIVKVSTQRNGYSCVYICLFYGMDNLLSPSPCLHCKCAACRFVRCGAQTILNMNATKEFAEGDPNPIPNAMVFLELVSIRRNHCSHEHCFLTCVSSTSNYDMVLRLMSHNQPT